MKVYKLMYQYRKTKKRFTKRKTKLIKKLDQLLMLLVVAIALVIAFIAYVYVKGMLPYWQLQALQPQQPNVALYGLGLVATGLTSYVVVKVVNDYTNRSLPERLIKALPTEAFKYRSTAKVLGSSNQAWKVVEPMKQIEDTQSSETVIDGETLEPIKQITFNEAYNQSDKYQWNIGQIEGTEELATFNFTKQSHVLVCGGTNCGKTSTTGFLLTLYALKSRFHVVVFDGANGADWKPFEQYVEFYDEAQPEHLETIISNIERLYTERQQQLKELGVADNYSLDKPLQPIVILIDELGYLLDGLKGNDKAKYKSVVARFQKMIRVIRKVSIHLVLIDQNANSIPQEILTNIKCIFAFNAEGHIGNAIKRYNLDKLKAQGQFNYQGKIVDGWYTKKFLPNYLPSLKPVNQVLMLTDSQLKDDCVVAADVVKQQIVPCTVDAKVDNKDNGGIAAISTVQVQSSTIVQPPKFVSTKSELINKLLEAIKAGELVNDNRVRKLHQEIYQKSINGQMSKQILEYVLSNVQK